VVLGETLDRPFDARDGFDRVELRGDERLGQRLGVGVDGVFLAYVGERPAVGLLGEVGEVAEEVLVVRVDSFVARVDTRPLEGLGDDLAVVARPPHQRPVYVEEYRGHVASLRRTHSELPHPTARLTARA
jgi:hypothetical protein